MPRYLVCLAALFLFACQAEPAETPPADETIPAETTPAETTADGEWVALFDGSSLDAFRGYKMERIPGGWEIEDGTITFDPDGERGGLMTKQQYGDFELEWEWKMPPEGNSGVIYRVTENYDAAWHTGPEYQLIDDEGYPGGIRPEQRTGANYDLDAPTVDALNPPGEWNASRIVVDDNHVEHWLNGEKVVEYELGSEEWRAKVEASKFNEFPEFGQNERGYIVFQDHGDPIWYRNIRIREL